MSGNADLPEKSQRRIADAELAAKHLEGTGQTRFAALVRALIRSHRAVVRSKKETVSMNVEYTTLEDMQNWAKGVMSRDPDFIVGDNQLRRWWIIPRNEWGNVYLHEVLKSDDDRALHDHPWANTSIIISGEYIDVTPDGEFLRKAGDVIHRKAADSHRLVVPEGGRAISLFTTGQWERDWGFHCPQGWVYWKDFTNPENYGKVGRGCGEQ